MTHKLGSYPQAMVWAQAGPVGRPLDRGCALTAKRPAWVFLQVLAVLQAKKVELLEQTQLLLAGKPKRMAEAVVAQYKELDRKLRAKPTDPETVKEQRDLIEELPKHVEALMEAMDETKAYYGALEKLQCPLSDADFDVMSKAQGWPMKVEQTVESVEASLQAEQEKYKAEQQAEQESFELHLNDLNNQIASCQQHTDMSKTEEVAALMLKLQGELQKAVADSAVFNSREALFGAELSDYGRIKKMLDTFDPFLQVRRSANRHPWHAAPIRMRRSCSCIFGGCTTAAYDGVRQAREGCLHA